MKFFRSITFKIFMIVFVSFMIIGGISFYNNYDNYMNNWYSILYGEDQSIQYFDNQITSFNENWYNNVAGYTKDDSSKMIADIYKYLEQSNSIVYYLDRDFNLIESYDNYQYTQMSILDFYEEDQADLYQVDLSTFDQKTINKMLSYLKKHPDENIKFYGKIDV